MSEQWKPKKIGAEVLREGLAGNLSGYTEYAQEIANEQVVFASEMLGLTKEEAQWLRNGFQEDLDRVSEAIKHVSYSDEGLTSEKGSPFEQVRISASRLALWSVMERIGGIGATTQDALRVSEQAVALSSTLVKQALKKEGIVIDESDVKRISAMSGEELANTVTGMGGVARNGLIAEDDRSRERITKYPAAHHLDRGVERAGTIGVLLANGGWNAAQPARSIAEKDEKWIKESQMAYGPFSKMVRASFASVSFQSPDVSFARAVYEVLKDVLQVTKMVTARHLWKEGENKAVDLVKLRKGPAGWLVRVHKREEDGVLPAALKPWALPGGFVENDSDAAALREANEEHGEHTEGELYECFPRQVVEDPRNIPGDRWISSHGFVQVVTSFEDTDDVQEGEVSRGSKAWVPVSELLQHHAMYGSHVAIVKAAVAKAESLA